MSVRVLNIALLVVFLSLVATIFLVRRNYASRNVEVLPGMVTHVSYSPQSSNPNFTDGKTMQSPVAGTVVRGYEPLPYKETPEDALRAGIEMTNPLPQEDSTATLRRGAAVFATVCSPCHGAGGAGDGAIPQRGFPPPPSLFADNALKMSDGQMFHAVTYGVRNMPSFATQVVRDDRWRVIAYIRSLQAVAATTTVSVK